MVQCVSDKRTRVKRNWYRRLYVISLSNLASQCNANKLNNRLMSKNPDCILQFTLKIERALNQT